MRSGADPEALDAVWADALGCVPADLRRDRTVVVPHGPPLRGAVALWVFRRRGACVVSAPAPMVGPLSPLAQRHPPGEWFNRQFLLDVLRHPVRRVVGPVRVLRAIAGVPSWQTAVPGQQAAPGVAEYAKYYAVLLNPTWP